LAAIIARLEEINRNPSKSTVREELMNLDFDVDKILENIETEEVQTTFTAVYVEGGRGNPQAADRAADEEAQTFI